MATKIITKLGTHRGKHRVWLEGIKLSREDFNAGDQYDVTVSNNSVKLSKSAEGKYRVSKRKKNGELLPIIDLSINDLGKVFSGVDRLNVELDSGKMVITAHQNHNKQIKRELATLDRIKKGLPLRTVSLLHGGGVLDSAIHDGLSQTLHGTKLSVCNEIESKYLDSSLKNNSHLFSQETYLIEAPLELVDFKELHNLNLQVDLLVGSLPCTGASKAGKAKNKNTFAESHETAGAVFHSYLKAIEAFQPSVIVMENVGEFFSSASMAVIRSVLSTSGYNIHEGELRGEDFKVHEHRNRMAMVALSKGLGEFDFDSVVKLGTTNQPISEILENISQDSERFKDLEYLRLKEIEDIKNNKGFRRSLLNGTETKCSCLGRYYSKYRSTESMILHSDGIKSRLFTPVEHAKVKGINPRIIEGINDTTAHEILGQSIIYPAFVELAKALGKTLKEATGSKVMKDIKNVISAPVRIVNLSSKMARKTSPQKQTKTTYIQQDLFA